MSPKTFRFDLAKIRPWLTTIAIIWILGIVGLGWLVKSVLILIGLIFLLPVLAFLGFSWWLRRNLIQDKCPVCHYEFAGLNQTQLQCPNCGERLLVEHRHFNRVTPPGTIEVQAVEVPSNSED
ncbi:MAG: hypothetical protein JOZ78_18795 [Chroococcidiopsidaceae cyanobacterium CP_BM_ER_R8_30]|nr:hypothetical protein [Chroococcidiopsidaceae cyanobacterium CP_BM_ER_R8_30]